MGYMGILEKKMESTIVCWGYKGNNGKGNGNCHYGVIWSLAFRDLGLWNYYIILGLYGDIGKELEGSIQWW